MELGRKMKFHVEEKLGTWKQSHQVRSQNLKKSIYFVAKLSEGFSPVCVAPHPERISQSATSMSGVHSCTLSVTTFFRLNF